jgi:hypothetical protein
MILTFKSEERFRYFCVGLALFKSVFTVARLPALLVLPFDVNLRCDERSHFLKLPFRLAAAAADEFTNALAESSVSLI